MAPKFILPMAGPRVPPEKQSSIGAKNPGNVERLEF